MRRKEPARISLPRGFTLLELMIVIGIAALMMTAAVPFVGGMLNERPLVKTTNEIMEALGHARAQAVLHGKPAVLRIFPQEGVFKVMPAGAGVSREMLQDSEFMAGEAPGIASDEGKSLFTAKLKPEIIVEMIDVNFIDVRNQEVADVYFYPNGTCDAFTMVIRVDDRWRLIRLDMVTGMSEFEVDPQEFMK